MAWLDAESAVADRLSGLGEAVTEMPAKLADHLPLIYVRRAGGVDEVRQVVCNVVVEVYGATRAQAWQVAEDAALLLLKGGGFVARPDGSDPVAIGKVTSVSANTRLPWSDPKIRLVVATYRLVADRDGALID